MHGDLPPLSHTSSWRKHRTALPCKVQDAMEITHGNTGIMQSAVSNFVKSWTQKM